MALVSLYELPPKGSLLGLDPGTKTIGVAGCDIGRMIASGLETIVRGTNSCDGSRTTPWGTVFWSRSRRARLQAAIFMA